MSVSVTTSIFFFGLPSLEPRRFLLTRMFMRWRPDFPPPLAAGAGSPRSSASWASFHGSEKTPRATPGAEIGRAA